MEKPKIDPGRLLGSVVYCPVMEATVMVVEMTAGVRGQKTTVTCWPSGEWEASMPTPKFLDSVRFLEEYTETEADKETMAYRLRVEKSRAGVTFYSVDQADQMKVPVLLFRDQGSDLLTVVVDPDVKATPVTDDWMRLTEPVKWPVLVPMAPEADLEPVEMADVEFTEEDGDGSGSTLKLVPPVTSSDGEDESTPPTEPQK